MKRIRTLFAAAPLLLFAPAALTVVAQQARGSSDQVAMAYGPTAGSGYRDDMYREVQCVLGCYVRVGAQISAPSALVAPGANVPGRAAPPVPAAPPVAPRLAVPAAPAAPAAPVATPDLQRTTGSGGTGAAATAVQGSFGNTATPRLPVAARDTTSPILSLPRLVTAVAVAPAGAPVAFAMAATDLVDGTARAVTCQPASGSVFPIGTTRVSCSATDSHANVATGNFNVVVEPPSATGRMLGKGSVAAGNQIHHFTFNIAKRGLRSEDSSFDDDVVTKVEGHEQHDRFRATLVTSAYFFDAPGSVPGPQPRSGIDQVFFAGLGTWNGQAGFTFQAVVVDAGEPGKGADTVALTIRRAGGAVVADVVGQLAEGNIDSYER